MKLHVTGGCRALRGRAYFHAIADAGGCRPLPSHVNRYWHSLQPRVSLNRSRWERAKLGAQLSTRTRLELSSYHPHLDVMFSNPIWAVLDDTRAPEYWNALADTIEVQGRPLREWKSLRPGRLFQRIDWSCICIFLVLWRTTSLVYCAYRRWVEDNFSDIFLLFTLQLPIMHIRKELYERLTAEVKVRIQDPRVGQLWFDWPERYAAYEECFQHLISLDWLEGRRDLFVLLLWHLRPEVNEVLRLGEQPIDPSCAVQRFRAIRRRFHRKVRCCRINVITLNGISCEFGWPPRAIALEMQEKIPTPNALR